MKPITPQYCQCKYPLIRVDPFNKEYCGKCDRYFEEIKIRKMKQITPQEIKIGNYVNFQGKEKRVLGISKFNYITKTETTGYYIEFENFHFPVNFIHITAIELTEEILLRLGFIGNGKNYVFEDYIFLELEDGDWDDCCMDFSIETADMKHPYYITCVSSLHQLQNVYHAISGGKELELKPKQ